MHATQPTKSPVLAAILNFLFWAGYWYLGFKKVLGIPSPIFVVLGIILGILGLIWQITLGIVVLIVSIILAFDGYKKGRGEKGLDFISTEPPSLPALLPPTPPAYPPAAPPPTVTTPRLVCPRCGAELAGEEDFCTNCGYRIKG